MDDPIVDFRRRKNQLALLHRDLAFNAEGLRVLKLLENGIDQGQAMLDVIKFSLIMRLYLIFIHQYKDNNSPANSQDNETIFNGNVFLEKNIMDELSINSIDDYDDEDMFSCSLDGQSSMTIDCDFDVLMTELEDDINEDFFHDLIQECEMFAFESDDPSSFDFGGGRAEETDYMEDYEDILTIYSILLGCKLDDVHRLCAEMVDLSAIRESEWIEKTRVAITPKQNRTINEHTDIDMINMTRFNKAQLRKILFQFFNDEHGEIYSCNNHKFTYEETLLIALSYMANGEKYLSMYKHFGGDWPAYTYPINWFTNFLFAKYYHRISGTSMEYWASSTDDFRKAIWEKVCIDGDGDILMPFGEFYNFAFMDCIQHSTCSPGSGPINANNDRRENRFEIQRAFYTAYGKKWGLKSQGLLLPNGMIGNAWSCSIAHNDKGVVNLSGIEEELLRVLAPYKIGLHFPTVYTDEIYEISEVINKRNGQVGEYFDKMSSERQNVEHLFGATVNLWKRLSKKYTWKIMKQGTGAIKHIMAIWLMTNVYTCLNGNKVSMHYNFPRPSLREYLSNVPPYTGNI